MKLPVDLKCPEIHCKARLLKKKKGNMILYTCPAGCADSFWLIKKKGKKNA